MDMTIKDGVRCSASKAYLHPALKERRNLTVDTKAFVTRILFEKNRAIGVEYLLKGEIHQVGELLRLFFSCKRSYKPKPIKIAIYAELSWRTTMNG